MLAIAEWLFRDQGFERMELRTPADNTDSQQVAQKLGCISEGVLRNARIARTRTENGTDGGWTDIRTDLIVWGLLPEDLEGVAEQLADARRLRHVQRLEVAPPLPRTAARSTEVRTRYSHPCPAYAEPRPAYAGHPLSLPPTPPGDRRRWPTGSR